jgi:hypothetical protein
MRTKHLIIAGLAAVATPALATEGQFGTTQEAHAMLERAIDALKTDGLAATKKFNFNGEPFRDRDLFVFCFGKKDGVFTAHEAMVGRNISEFHDRAGKAMFEEMDRIAQPSQISEVSFLSPVPGTTRIATRLAYIAAIGDQVCGVSAFLD